MFIFSSNFVVNHMIFSPSFLLGEHCYRIYQAATAYSKSLSTGTKQLGGSGTGEITLRIHRGGAAARSGTSSELLKLPSVESDCSSSPSGLKRKSTKTVSKKLSRWGGGSGLDNQTKQEEKV